MRASKRRSHHSWVLAPGGERAHSTKPSVSRAARAAAMSSGSSPSGVANALGVTGPSPSSRPRRISISAESGEGRAGGGGERSPPPPVGGGWGEGAAGSVDASPLPPTPPPKGGGGPCPPPRRRPHRLELPQPFHRHPQPRLPRAQQCNAMI